MKSHKVLPKKIEAKLLKLDFGCGPNPVEGFDGVDSIKFNDKIKYVVDLTGRYSESEYGQAIDAGKHIGNLKPYPFKDESVECARASHFIEHLNAYERVHFMNELHRILIPGGTFDMIVPHWASNRAYGDPTHQWPPVAEMWFYYLKKDWRESQAPHTDIKHNPDGFNCNFEATWGYSLRQDLAVKNTEYQQNAIANYKEVCQDLIAKLVKQ